MLLALTLAIAASRASVTPYIIEVDHLDEARAVNTEMHPGPPSDAQVAYFLARFVSNVRSLSVDPIVVQANWLDALSYVTGCGARTLNDYARDAEHRRDDCQLGLRPDTAPAQPVSRCAQKKRPDV